jgi:hypothetical protein
MAVTIANALKALIEGAGLGLSGVRDQTARGRPYPYVRIQEGLDVGPDQANPRANPDSGDYSVSELVQVDLLMQKASPHTGESTESFTLPDDLHRVLHGGVLEMAPKRVYGMRVIGRTRLPDMPTRATNQPRNQAPQPSGVVKVAYSVIVHRTL